MQKLMKLNDLFVYYLPYDNVRIVLGYSTKAPKVGVRFSSDDSVYIVCSVDTVFREVICKHA